LSRRRNALTFVNKRWIGRSGCRLMAVNTLVAALR
jgi:hypothetical protein